MSFGEEIVVFVASIVGLGAVMAGAFALFR